MRFIPYTDDRAVMGRVRVADELVQLDVMDVAALAELGSMEDHEDVVAVGADLGDGVALHAGPDGERMEVEDLGQHPGGRLVAAGSRSLRPWDSPFG